MEKLKVLVLFGGQSSEHSISELSATNIISNLNTDKYELYLVGITQAGKWYLYEGDVADIKGGLWEQSGKLTPAVLVPDATMGGLLVMDGDKTQLIEMDVVFPVLHGKYGEDGTIQGLCALAGLPCVGPDMLSSAMCMDKTVAKVMFQYLEIPQARWVTVHSFELDKDIEGAVARVESAFPYPVFVKPACAGSSVGIGKAKNREMLIEALFTAADHDDKILVEEFIPGKEVECAVLGNRDLTVSHPGQIISAKEFYDFEAKYEIASTIQIPADLPETVTETIRSYAAKIFLGFGLSGLSRIDFFVHENGQVMINEVNTLPGFTDISMYPKMMENDGIPQPEQLDRLIDLAVEKFVGSDDEDDSASFEGDIHVCLSQSDNAGDESREEYTVPCSYVYDGEAAVVSYFEPETEEGTRPVRCKIMLDKSSCTIIRSGEMQSEFRFEKGNTDSYEISYQTPYGAVPFTVLPQKAEFSARNKGCTANLSYALEHKGEPTIKNTIQFEVTSCEKE